MLRAGVKEVMFKLPEAMGDTMNRDATSYYVDDANIIISDDIQTVLSIDKRLNVRILYVCVRIIFYILLTN